MVSATGTQVSSLPASSVFAVPTTVKVAVQTLVEEGQQNVSAENLQRLEALSKVKVLSTAKGELIVRLHNADKKPIVRYDAVLIMLQGQFVGPHFAAP